MEDLDVIKARVKKLNAQAVQAKMDLHDLSEDLPTNWENILDVAQRAYDAHKNLMAARKEMAAASLTAPRPNPPENCHGLIFRDTAQR